MGTLVAEGKFREDLYYRLNEIQLDLPPLRDREGDVVILAQYFLNLFTRELSRSLRGFTEEALAALSDYKWPGNIRELENRLKRAVIMADGPTYNAAGPGASLRGQTLEVLIFGTTCRNWKALS